jgi:hypothetical protein
METVRTKIETAVRLLRSIDDDLQNDICLVSPEMDDSEPLTEFSYWGVADMLLDHLERLGDAENE